MNADRGQGTLSFSLGRHSRPSGVTADMPAVTTKTCRQMTFRVKDAPGLSTYLGTASKEKII